jgi:hypothetical protein
MFLALVCAAWLTVLHGAAAAGPAQDFPDLLAKSLLFIEVRGGEGQQIPAPHVFALISWHV